MAEHEAVTAREAGRIGGRTLELVDHLAFGHGDAAERDRKAEVLGEELDLDLAEADLGGEWMGAAEPALGGIAEREQESFVAAGQVLQAHVAAGRERERLARQIAGGRLARRRRLDQV